MKNYVATGETLDYTVAGTAIVSGDLRFIGSIPAVATTSGAVGDVVAMKTKGVFTLPKTAGNGAISQGAPVYQDAVAGTMINTSNTGANALVGYAFVSATNAATSVQVRLLQL